MGLFATFAFAVAAVASPFGRSDPQAELCSLAPALTVCATTPEKLDADAARARIDDEFQRLSKQSDSAALQFALSSFNAATLQKNDRAYGEMRSRALVVAYAAPAEATDRDKIRFENDGDRFFAFETIGFISFRAGDRRSALEMATERLPLVRNLPDDGGWERHYADVGIWVSKIDAYMRIAREAAEFGDLGLARTVVKEAYGRKPETEFEYFLNLSTIENLAGAFEKAEKNARLALNKAPSEFCKKIAPFESKRIPAHFSLIESLAKQSKEFSEEANKLRRDITAFCTYLSGHAFAFFSTAEDLAQFAPAVARDFITAGRLIQEADSESQTMTSRDTEAAACKAVGDKSCLLEIARYEEEQLNKENSYWADQVAKCLNQNS